MDSELVVAVTSVIAILLSVLSIWRTHVAESSRKVWESHQDSRRHHQAKELQDRQNKWQEQQAERQRKWEEKWRVEQAQREQARDSPQLDVRLNPGVIFDERTGVKSIVLWTTAKNVGFVPIYFSNWGGFVLPDGMIMERPFGRNSLKYGEKFDFSQALDPGDDAVSYIETDHLKKLLAKNGYAGQVEIRGRFVDRLGNEYQSNDYIVSVSS